MPAAVVDPGCLSFYDEIPICDICGEPAAFMSNTTSDGKEICVDCLMTGGNDVVCADISKLTLEQAVALIDSNRAAL